MAHTQSASRSAVLVFVCLSFGCGGSRGAADSGSSASGASSCQAGTGLPEYRHTLAHSRFGLGTLMEEKDEFGMHRWVGSEGVFAVMTANGAAMGILNAGASSAQRPSWGANGQEHTDHVRAYFVQAGVPECEILMVGTNGGSSGYASPMARGISNVPIADSIAWASINDVDVSTGETVYWPAVPASAIADARSFVAMTPTQWQAYRAKLPAGLSDTGSPPAESVSIHHSSFTSTGAFRAVATYDALVSSPMGMGATRHFDINGTEVMEPF